MEPSRSLTACLSKALKDEELVPDIASACALAGWDTPVRLLESASEKEVAEKLFLTPQEAHTLLKECSAANEGEQRVQVSAGSHGASSVAALQHGNRPTKQPQRSIAGRQSTPLRLHKRHASC